jgi:hypothetical protein
LEERHGKGSSGRFELINRTIRLKSLTRYLCKLSGVSVSGYYRWLAVEEVRQLREDVDESDLASFLSHL